MNGIMQDLTFALRLLRKRPGASAVIIITLALGIGLNATFFSVYFGMAVRPLPFEEPDRLVTINRARPETGETYLAPAPADRYEFARSSELATLGAYDVSSFNLRSEGPPERVGGAFITVGLFEILGAEPAMGRLFEDEEGRPGGPKAAIFGDGLWRRSYGADPTIVGQSIRVDGEAVEVVGIMPPRFEFPLTQELWMPLQGDEATAARKGNGINLLGRLAPGASVESLQASLEARMPELQASFPEAYEDLSVKVRSLHEAWMPPVTRVAAVAMQALASLVLLIVCANVANMVLAQSTLRRQERALRATLGASRMRLIRQSLLESLVLALLGGGFGILLTIWQGDWMGKISAVPVPFWLEFTIDGPVLAYACAITLVTAVGIGVAPALRGGRGLVEALKSGGRSDGGTAGGDGRLRTALVVAEYALAVVVLVGALLMLRAYDRLQNADTGFAVQDRLTLKLALPSGDAGDRERGLEIVRRSVEALEALPEVRAATAMSYLPIENGPYQEGRLDVEGHEFAEGGEPKVAVHSVAAGFFDTLEIPVLAGREFTAGEHEAGRPSALVSASLAARLWPGESALGRRIRLSGDSFPWLEVVGVTRDLQPGEPLAGIDRRSADQIYVPISLEAERQRGMLAVSPVLIVHSAASAEALGPSLRRSLAVAHPDVPIFLYRSMEHVLRQYYFAQHIWSRMFALIAFVALGIAAVGAYGVSAYAVNRRMREIGIRLALGAQPGRLMRAVIGRGLSHAGLGLALGMAAAIPMVGAMSGLLHGISLWDPRVLGGVLLLLGGVAGLATVLPARRAAGVDPVVTLRES